MHDNEEKQTFAERIHNTNVLPDGNLLSVNPVQALSVKMQIDIIKEEKQNEG